MRIWIFGLLAGLVVAASPAFAETFTIQSSDGTKVTVTELGGGKSVYKDTRGVTGVIEAAGGGKQRYRFNLPDGSVQTGTIMRTGKQVAQPLPMPVIPIPTPAAPAVVPPPQVAVPTPSPEVRTLPLLGTFGTYQDPIGPPSRR